MQRAFLVSSTGMVPQPHRLGNKYPIRFQMPQYDAARRALACAPFTQRVGGGQRPQNRLRSQAWNQPRGETFPRSFTCKLGEVSVDALYILPPPRKLR